MTLNKDRKQTKYGHKRREHMTHTTEDWQYGGEDKSNHQMSLMRIILKASSNEQVLLHNFESLQKASVSHHYRQLNASPALM